MYNTRSQPSDVLVGKLSESVSGIELSMERNPLLGVDTTNVSAVVRAIDNASWSVFQQVPFAAWALKAVGKEVDLVDEFIWYHDMLATRLYIRLKRCAERNSIALQLFTVGQLVLHPTCTHANCAQATPCVSAFARSVILSGLGSPKDGVVASDLETDFIVRPLARLFARPVYESVDIDAILGILQVRYQRTYHQQREFDAVTEFRTDFSFFHGLTTTHPSPAAFACLISNEDLKLFEENILFDLGTDELGRSWNRRCGEVVECIRVRSELLDVLVELALVS